MGDTMLNFLTDAAGSNPTLMDRADGFLDLILNMGTKITDWLTANELASYFILAVITVIAIGIIIYVINAFRNK